MARDNHWPPDLDPISGEAVVCFGSGGAGGFEFLPLKIDKNFFMIPCLPAVDGTSGGLAVPCGGASVAPEGIAAVAGRLG